MVLKQINPECGCFQNYGELKFLSWYRIDFLPIYCLWKLPSLVLDCFSSSNNNNNNNVLMQKVKFSVSLAR